MLKIWGIRVNQKLPNDLCRLIFDALNKGLNKETQLINGDNAFSLTFTPIVDQGYVNIYGRNISDRILAERELLKSHEKLEKRVEERTAELLKANEQLSREVEERNKSEKTLKAVRDRLSLIYNSVSDLIFLMSVEPDDGFRCLTVNETYLNNTGLTEYHLIGKRIEEIIPEPASGYLVNKYKEAIRKGVPIRYEETADLPKGRRTYSTTLNPIFDKDGTCTHLLGTAHDITEQKKTEEETQRNYYIQTVINSLLSISLKNISLDEQLDLILEQIVSIFWLTVESKGGIFLVDDSGILELKAHRGFTEEQKALCGRVPSGKCLCGRALSSEKIEFADSIDDRHENRYEGMPPHGHYCVPITSSEKILGVLALYLKEGHLRNINEEEHLRAIANILAGIIQKKKGEEELDKMEAQLRQIQKIEAIGQLAGGVAHDFNNIMTVIQGNTDLALMKIGEDEPVYRNLLEIRRVNAKAAALTRQLLTFSRRQPVSKEILNINKAVLEMSRMLQRLIGENISLRTELPPDLWNTEADPGQVEQLLMNLVINARDAMPDGGKLLIKTENARIDETYRQIYGEGRPGRFVRISVEDTGTGMDAKTRAHIFEPFFTTKGIGKGTGLGLSVVYGIVKGHDGWINVYSEPGSGSSFRIYLPAVSGGIEEKGEEAKSADIRGGNERILLVEDEKDVRELALLMLERQGYKIFAASTFDEAVSIFKKEGEMIDLLLSDMVLTDRSGLELAKELRRERPDLKVLFASGYSGEHFQMQEDDFHFLEKPYTLTELLNSVRDVLDERG